MFVQAQNGCKTIAKNSKPKKHVIKEVPRATAVDKIVVEVPFYGDIQGFSNHLNLDLTVGDYINE